MDFFHEVQRSKKIMVKALATKNVVAVLTAVALMVGISFAFAAPAKADTVSTLQAQVAALLAQIQGLQGSTTTTTSTTAGCYTFTQNLKNGSTGGQVLWVQKFLNNHGFTVAKTGAGSPGNETSHFGPATKAAVIAFQNAYASAVLTPAGLTAGNGNWYAGTRAQANALCAGSTTGTTTGGGTTTSGPGITVTAGAQPANALAVTGASRVPFTTLTLTNNTSAAVTINGITVQRTGPASDSVFNGGGVVLVDDQGNQLGVQRTLNSDHTVSAGDPFILNAGQTKTITVAANMCNTTSCLSSYSGEVVGLTVTGINTTVPVAGTLPISGAQQTINSNLAIGYVTTNVSSYDPNGSQQKNIGDTGIKFSGLRFTAGSQEDIKLFSIRFRLNGSVSSSDLANVVGVVADTGTTYPTTVSTDGRYYTVSFPGGILIQKGFSKDVYLQGDVVGSNASGRIVEFDVDRTSDVYFVGQSYGYGIQPAPGTVGLATNASDGTHGTVITNTQPWFEGSTVKISGASVTTIGRANSVAAQNIAVNVPNVVLGGFETNLKGEGVQVQTLPVTVTTTSSGVATLTNVTIVDENGSVVSGPVDQSGGTVTFNNTITFPTGDHVYTIKGKVAATADNNSTIKLTTDAHAWTGITGVTTGNNVVLAATAQPFDMNTMTIRGATMAAALSANPAAQTLTPGTQHFVFANVQLDATQSGEDIRVSNLPVTITATSTGLLADLNACQVYDGTNALTTGSNTVNPTGASVNFTFDNSITVTKGTVKTLSVECNVSSNTPNTTTYKVGLTDNGSGVIAGLNATGVTSSNTVNVTGTTNLGQIMTAGTATLAVSLDSSSPSAMIVAGGTSGVTLGAYKFRATNDTINLQQVGLTLNSGHIGDLQDITLWNGSTQVGSAILSGSSVLMNLSTPVALANNTDVVLTLKGDLTNVGTNQSGTSGDLIQINATTSINSTYGTSASGSRINATGGTAVSGVMVYKTFPAFARIGLSSAALTTGTVDLYRFSVTPNSTGDIGLNQITINIATSTYTSANGSTNVSNIKVYAYTDANFSSPVGQGFVSGLLNTTGVVANGGNTKIAFDAPVQISAQTPMYFKVVGDVSQLAGTSGAAGSITSKIVGDGTVQALTIASTANNGNNFVWSPNTFGTAVVGASDWTNGNLVTGLPAAGTDVTTLTK
jgi:hypothetical protein